MILKACKPIVYIEFLPSKGSVLIENCLFKCLLLADKRPFIFMIWKMSIILTAP